jgi:hypothetical protein
MIPLKDWNSYLKSIYEFPNALYTFQNVPIDDEVFSMEDIEFGIKQLTNGKNNNIESYQVAKILNQRAYTYPSHT